MISTQLAEAIRDSLITQIDEGIIPTEVKQTKEYLTFLKLLRYMPSECAYTASIIKVMTNNHPELIPILLKGITHE